MFVSLSTVIWETEGVILKGGKTFKTSITKQINSTNITSYTYNGKQKKSQIQWSDRYYYSIDSPFIRKLGSKFVSLSILKQFNSIWNNYSQSKPTLYIWTTIEMVPYEGFPFYFSCAVRRSRCIDPKHLSCSWPFWTWAWSYFFSDSGAQSQLKSLQMLEMSLPSQNQYRMRNSSSHILIWSPYFALPFQTDNN